MDGPGGAVSGTLVTSLDAAPGMPALILGHDLASDHHTERYVALACEYARRDGFAVAILDGPFHGDRQPSFVAEMEPGPERFARMRAELSKPGQSAAMSADWRLLVDVLIALPQVAATTIGFEAVSMSALLGVTFVADDPRIECAVFHVIGIRTGDQSTAGPELGGEPFAATVARIGQRPVQLQACADDVLFSRASSDLFLDTLTGPDKELLVLPGVHFDPPLKPISSREYAAAFLRRHLRP
jgi:pimeloyl-ACP methyl ester carboxylesterase